MAHNLKIIKGGNEPSVGTEKWSDKIRKQAKSLATQLDEGYMEMAHLLWQIYDKPIDGAEGGPMFMRWNYSSFAEYCQEELGMHRKRAQRLRNVWFNLEIRLKDQIDPAVKKRLVSLGFSKVRELVRVLSAKNVEKWVEKGEELNYPKLCLAIQQYTERLERAAVKREGGEAAGEGDSEESAEGGSGGSGGSGGPAGVDTRMGSRDPTVEVPNLTDEDMHPRHFMFYTEQVEMVDEALDAAKRLSNSDVKSNNMHFICMDFLAHNNFGKASRKTKLKYVAHMEQILGFKLIASDGPDVIYGLKTLENLAAPEDE